MSKKLLLVMNPCAGIKKSNKYLTDILNVFAVNDYECTVQLTTLKIRAADIVEKYGKHKDLIVCIGGDGTFNETVSGMLKADIHAKLGYIPSGSTNDFASSLGLNSNPVKAAEDIAYGDAVNFDVGLFNSRPFTYVASFGVFTKASYAASRDLKNMLGHLAYILEGMKELGDIKPFDVTVKTADKTYSGKYLFGAVCNSTIVGGGVIKLPKDLVDMNDGLFETVLVKNPETPTDFMQLLIDLQTFNYKGNMFEFFTSDKVEITADPNMNWTLDGEYEKGCRDITIENLHSAISLMIKRKYEG